MGLESTSLIPSVAARVPALAPLLQSLQPRLRLQHAPKRSVIAQEGDGAAPFLMVASGWLSQSKMLPEGEIEIIDFLLPGDVALIAGPGARMAAYTVEALTDASFVTFGVDIVNRPEPAAAQLRLALMNRVVAAQARAAALMLRLGRSPAATRIAYVLLALFARLEAAGAAKGARFEVPLNQEAIGRFAGLSNVHVCRTLRRFERDGVARSTDHVIEILDVDALCRIAGLEADTFRSEILMELEAQAGPQAA